jgi:predicted esterase
MKKYLVVLILAVFAFVSAVLASPAEVYSEETVTGHSNGNHALDCTVIRPWDSSSSPGSHLYPVIVWANGWGGNDVAGEYTTEWYKPQLIEWALDGPYIVVAANQWSAQESDVLACLEWILGQNDDSESEYYGVANGSKIGLAGHSQGAGAVVKAGDGEPNGFNITTVVAMNPYGPSWVDAANQDGPMMIITGSEDETTPLSWTYPVFEAVQTNDQGGLFTVLQGAGHSDLKEYQTVVKLWWQFTSNGRVNAGKALVRILNKAPWDTQYAFTDEFDF